MKNVLCFQAMCSKFGQEKSYSKLLSDFYFLFRRKDILNITSWLNRVLRMMFVKKLCPEQVIECSHLILENISLYQLLQCENALVFFSILTGLY